MLGSKVDKECLSLPDDTVLAPDCCSVSGLVSRIKKDVSNRYVFSLIKVTQKLNSLLGQITITITFATMVGFGRFDPST